MAPLTLSAGLVLLGTLAASVAAQSTDPGWYCFQHQGTCPIGLVVTGLCTGGPNEGCKDKDIPCSNDDKPKTAVLCSDFAPLPPLTGAPSPSEVEGKDVVEAPVPAPMEAKETSNLRGTPPPSEVQWVGGAKGSNLVCPGNSVMIGNCRGQGKKCNGFEHSIACDTSIQIMKTDANCYWEYSKGHNHGSCADTRYVAAGACASPAKAPKACSGSANGLYCCQAHARPWQPAKGYWKLAGSVSGGGGFEETIEEGVTTTDTHSLTQTWEHSVTHSWSIGFSFMGFSSSYTVSYEYSHSISRMSSHSVTHETSQSCSAQCPPKDNQNIWVYQWIMEMGRQGDNQPTTTATTCNYFCLYAEKPTPPACPLSACTNDVCSECDPAARKQAASTVSVSDVAVSALS